MQARVMIVALMALLAASPYALASDYTAVEVGTSGETLRNSALPQDKHYISAETSLNGRIATLMADVDCLLQKLHALPAQRAQAPEIQQPVNAELKSLLELALANNPDLKPYQSKLAVLAARTRQSDALEDPMLSFMVMDVQFPMLPPDQRTMTSAEIEISQMYESYGKRKLKRSIARIDEQALELELAARELALARELAALYFDMAKTSAQLRVLEDNVKLMDLLLELAEAKYSVNDEMTPQAMVIDAQLMRSMLEERRISLQKLLDSQTVRLEGLLGRPAGFDPSTLMLRLDYPLPSAPEWDSALLLAETLDRLPDYQRMNLMREQDQLMITMAQREYKPDYTLSLRYNIDPGLRGMIGAGVMFPLFWHKEQRQDAKLQEAYATAVNTGDQQAAMENMLATMLQQMQVDLSQMTEMIQLYRTGLVPQARLGLDSSISSYAANMLQLSQLISAQQQLLEIELTLEESYIGYLAMLTDLQIVTAGAFDPQPYLAPSLTTQSSVAAQSLDLVESLPRAELELAAVAADATDAETTDAVVGPFIEELGLPATSGVDSGAPSIGQGNTPMPGGTAALQISQRAQALINSAQTQSEPVSNVWPDSLQPPASTDETGAAGFYEPFILREDNQL